MHRVIAVHDRAGEDVQDVLTKGDNNFGDDKARKHALEMACSTLVCCRYERACSHHVVTFSLPQVLYAEGQEWLNREHIMGRAVGYLPHVGRVTIIMNDYPYVKARRRALCGTIAHCVARACANAAATALLTHSTCSLACWACLW